MAGPCAHEADIQDCASNKQRGVLCFHNKGSCRRSFDASSQHVWLSVSIQVCLVLNTRSRPGPKSGVGCRLTTKLILLHCQVSHGVRVPALSVGAGEGNFLASPRRLQVPKLNGEQVTDGKQEPTHQWNRCVKRSFVRACNRAIRHGLCTCVPLVSFKYPRSV